MKRHRPTVEEGLRSLQEHATDCAHRARAEHGPVMDLPALRRVLQDARFVRYPVTVAFGDERLEVGEMAYPEARGATPSEGYVLWVHPRFEGRDQDLVPLIAYQLVMVNYGDVATHDEAELFGAALLGWDRETYYQRLCGFADELAEA